MPRPVSELTNNRRCIGAQLTPSQHEEWKRIGGVQWLRKQLAQSIEQRRKEEGQKC